MNKRIRSRVLAASIVSSTLFGTGGLLFPQRPARAQDRPTAVQLLERGSRLYEDKQYGEAKKILNDIDPAQLPEDQRKLRDDLVIKTDVALAKAMGPHGALDAAQADLDADRLTAAAKGFSAIIANPSTPADVKQNASIQLAVVKEKQTAKAPQMKELLAQAQSLYDQGKLDESQNALNTVVAVGADMGWDNNQKPAVLQSRINEKRAIARTGGVTPDTALAQAPSLPGAVPGSGAPVSPAPNPLDVNPATGTPTPADTQMAPVPANDTGSLLQQQIGSDAAKRDRALTLYHESLRLSDEAINRRPPQFPQAMAQAQAAVDLIDQNRVYFSEGESSALRDAASVRLQNAVIRRDEWNRTQALEDQRILAQQDLIHDQNIKNQKKRRVDELVRDARKLVEAVQYKEAANLLQQAVIIDAQDENARTMLRLLEDRINARVYQDLVHRQGEETIRQGNDSQEHLIPYADLMIYPDNWLEITRKRVGGEGSQDSAANRIARDRLNENLKEITAEQQGLEKVINFLRDNTNTNIFVNWKALEAAGIDRNTPVSVSLKEIPFRKALTTILAEVGGGTASLSYTIDDGIITISTKEDLNSAKYQIVRVFDIRDLLVQPQNRQAPTLSLGVSSQQAGQGGGGGGFGGQGSGQSGGQGTGLFGNSQQQTTQQDPTAQRATIVTNITDTIKTTVSPDTWRDNGGTIGSIRELNGQLIVNQTVDNQLEVMNLLQQLRETRAIQIAVEARLLLVSNNFLDDFRFGWNMDFPAGRLGSAVGPFSIGNLNTFTQAIPPATGVPGSITGSVPNPSLNLSATIIDNWTLSLLLAATQADKRTVTVTAPRVTIFNGQSGFIAVTNQQNFVSNFNQTVAGSANGGSAATGTNLTVSTLNTGVTLSVEATVSSDRRYVVMNIDPQLSTLDGIDTFATGGTTGNNTTGNNTTGNNTGTNTTTTLASPAFVQLPKISNTEVSTMVSIPDGGTLLIGGQKLVGESEIEIGVPVLSKIPGLNRLFTNRSFVKDERTLLVLVRPTIIIHREIENDLFGVGYDRATGYSGNNGPMPTTMMPSAPGGF